MFHDALDFAAEIRVAGSVHDVDVVILVFEGGVFGADVMPFSRSRSMESMRRSSWAWGLVGAEGALIVSAGSPPASSCHDQRGR